MTRHCGDCSLCCTLLPVKPLNKLASERCKHQRFRTGCAVYHRKGMPPECRIWNCRWLVADDTQDLRRPDRSHYVIDILPDIVMVQDNETGEQTKMPAVQVWIDPKYPDAHRDPELRNFIQRRAVDGMVTLIRYDSRKALAILAPPLADQWYEIMRDEPSPGFKGMWT